MSSDAASINTSPQHAAKALVRSYLEAMEQRDLAAASAMLAPGFRMLFPGGRAFDSLSALVQAARGRYRSANKRYERFDVMVADALAAALGGLQRLGHLGLVHHLGLDEDLAEFLTELACHGVS